jgi:ArsR family transcriptional regulator, cadmium/lead-responsive transcriptional repressor
MSEYQILTITFAQADMSTWRVEVPVVVTAQSPAVLLPEAAGGVEVVARSFRALGDPARLRLLAFLLGGEHTVTECVTHIGLSQGRISAHLACLAGCGYVEGHREGRYTWYKVADPRVADLVGLARSMAADNAAALAACVHTTPGPAEAGREAIAGT